MTVSKKCIDDDLVTPVGRSSSADNGCTSKRLPHQEAVDRDSPIPTPPERNVGDSGMRYSIACSMPRDRSGGQWDVNIAACYSHPTGNWVSNFNTTIMQWCIRDCSMCLGAEAIRRGEVWK